MSRYAAHATSNELRNTDCGLHIAKFSPHSRIRNHNVKPEGIENMKRLLWIGIGLLLMTWGCSENKDEIESVTHPEGWMTKSADNFHGAKVFASGLDNCRTCHGDKLDGGQAGVECLDCHLNNNLRYPHPDGWVVKDNANFHGKFIRGQGWSMSTCQSCHGNDYMGGRALKSCTTCHNQPGGPEFCGTCHGSLTNPAPPEDLMGRTSISEISVGAHQTHLTKGVACGVCHIEHFNIADPGHIDNTPYAEVNSHLQWDRTKQTCAGVICHSNQLIWTIPAR